MKTDTDNENESLKMNMVIYELTTKSAKHNSLPPNKKIKKEED